MWSRKELKTNAKALVKANYWKVVVASIVMMICGGAGAAASNKAASDDGSLAAAMSQYDMATIMAAVIVVLAAVAVGMVISGLISVFVFRPLMVGAQKLFLNCKEGKAQYNDLAFGFKNSYLKVVLTMFLKNLFIGLWSLLFVIPGIIKTYEYRMIPYLLADHPEMGRKEIFAKSKEMMKGNKWNAFVLDLSFIGWHLLSAITFGILQIFYVGPYVYLTNAELYHELSK